MGNHDMRRRHWAARRAVASRLIQFGVGATTAASIVRTLPAYLTVAMAGPLGHYGELHEGDFVAEGKPLAIAESDYDAAVDELAGVVTN